MTSFNWLRRNSNHDYCKKKPKVTGILRNYSIPAVINNLGSGWDDGDRGGSGRGGGCTAAAAAAAV